jgi:hypothetical protein
MSSNTTRVSFGQRAVVALVGFGAGLLIAASAALGTYFGYLTGSHFDWRLGVVFAGAALGGEIVKPFAMRAAFDALGRLNLLRAAACLSVALVCVGYSLASELALSATGRGDMVAERKSQSDGAGDARANRARWVAELGKLKESRPLSELEPLVASARPTCRIYVTAERRETVCAKDPKLLSEYGRAKRKAELEAKIDSTKQGTDKTADPLAAASAFYLGAAGYRFSSDELSIWLYLVPVLFLEIGSAFSVIVVRAMYPVRREPRRWFGWRRRTDAIVEPSTEPPPSVRTVPNPSELSGTVLKFKPRGRPVTEAKALAFVRAKLGSGERFPSQDAIAERFSVAKSTVSAWVSKWERAGLIARSRDGRCNVVSAGRALSA